MSINSSVRKMNRLIKEYNTSEPKCVHKSLLLRSLVILKGIRPDSESVFAPTIKTFMTYAKRPDRKGDYENGMGRHYYCSAHISGKEHSQINSYYKNGSGKCSKSARSMFEEDYTMALTMYCAGYYEKSAEFLGRAVHMISDMCCLPHATGMTYFSRASGFHKAYERLAESIYPDNLPEQKLHSIPEIFTSHSSFADDINRIVLETAQGLKAVKVDPLEAVKAHLLRTETVITALLMRFMEDVTASDREAHYIATGSGCRLIRGTDPLTIKVTEKGITFHGVNPSPESDINVTDRTFYAAHRHDGLFTLSPVKDKDGKVLEISDGKFVWHKFDPVHGEQLFKL